MTPRLVDYPVFWPGDLPFFAEERTSWTRQQTEAWAEWLRRAIPARTDHLLKFLDVEPSLPAADRFADVADRAAQLCASDPDAVAEAQRVVNVELRGHPTEIAVGNVPSGYTEAVGTDLALLAARSLQEAFPDLLRWEIVWKPKNHVSFRNPVLTTGPAWASFDPMLIGANTARDLVNGGMNRSVARKRYAAWEDNIRFSS